MQKNILQITISVDGTLLRLDDYRINDIIIVGCMHVRHATL